ncbi:MAG: zinc ribbon domain-containing protein [Acidobacteriota bacterium]
MEIDPNRDEIDLYDELLAFSELPPDEQVVIEEMDFISELEAAEVIQSPIAPQMIEIEEPPAAPPAVERITQSKLENLVDQSSLNLILEDESFKDILEGISPSKLAEKSSRPVQRAESPEPVEKTPAVTAPKEVPIKTAQAASSDKTAEKGREKPAASKLKAGTRITIREDTTAGGITLNAEDLLAEEDELTFTSQKSAAPPSAIEVLEKVSGPLKQEVLERISGSLDQEATKKDSGSLDQETAKKDSGSLKTEAPKKESGPLKIKVTKKDSGPLKSLPNFPEPAELPPEMHETGPLEPPSSHPSAKPPAPKKPTQPTGDLLRASAPLKITGFLNEPPPEPENTGGLVAICPVCGHQSDRQAIICIECGHLFNEKPSDDEVKLTCQDCGSKARPDEMFCPECGAILIGE